MPDPVTLKLAEPTYRERMLQLLDEVRGRIEAGETIALMTVEIQTESAFLIGTRGDITTLQIVGLLTQAIHDQCRRMVDA